jgi:DNA-binding transcriptional LysR family regulator
MSSCEPDADPPDREAASARQLERQVGLELLDRGPNGSTPTEPGRMLAEWSVRVLDPFDELLRSVSALRSAAEDSLRVAASFTIAEHLLPRWLGSLRRSSANVEVQLEVVNTARVLERVRSGAVELGFIEGAGPVRGLRSKVVAHDDLVVVCDPGHGWSRRRRPVSAHDLAACPLVTREAGSGTRDALVAALASEGLAMVPPILELASTSAVRAAVESGAGAGVLSRLAVADALAAGRLVEVRTDGLDLGRTLRAVWATKQPSPAARALLSQP